MKSLIIRASIDGSDPEIWRKIVVPADLSLPDLHEAMQIVFDWFDMHLHSFYLGELYGRGESARQFFLPDSLAEGLEGDDETQFTAGDLLVSPGDVLGYQYDFGDDWLHRLELLDVTEREPTERAAAESQRVTCEDGVRRGPAEDSGSIHGYTDLLAILADPEHPDYDFFRDWADGQTFSDQPFDPEAFDRDAVNRRLFEVFGDAATLGSITPLPPGGLEDFAGRTPPYFTRSFRGWVRRSGLREQRDPVDTDSAIDAELSVLDDAQQRQLCRPYRWMLERIGTKGVKLTSAGYLPPTVVGAAMDELGWREPWIGTSNRELDAFPVLILRESMQKFRLLRKSKGVLLPTPAGRAALVDPLPLNRHMAKAIVQRQKEQVDRDVAVLVLALAAADDSGLQNHHMIADHLSALGWSVDGFKPIMAYDAQTLAIPIRDDLTNIGVFQKPEMAGIRGNIVTEAGRIFARATLAGFDVR